MVRLVRITASLIRILALMLPIAIQHTVMYCADYIIMLTLTLLPMHLIGTVHQLPAMMVGTQQTVQHMYQLHVVAKV